MAASPPISLWMEQLGDSLSPRPALAGDIEADVAIVGAGYTGLWTAYYLKQQLPALRVVVLEAEIAGFGASGRNGGQAIPGWSCDMPPLEKALGIERARRLWDGMSWAARELRELPERHGFDCDYRRGHLWTAVLPRRVALLHEWQEEAAYKWGHRALQFVSREQMPEWVASERYRAGLYDP